MKAIAKDFQFFLITMGILFWPFGLVTVVAVLSR